MNEWSLNIYRNFEDELETVWKELEGKCHHYYIFQCYDWLFHWQQTIGCKYSINPLIITVSHRDTVVALYPFALRRIMGAKILEFMGGEQSDYNAPIIADEYLSIENMLMIWHKVKAALPAHDIKLFLRIPQSIAKVENNLCSIWAMRKVSYAYSSTLPKSLKELKDIIPKKIISDSRRQTKRLSEQGKLFFFVAKTDLEYKRLIRPMLEQKRTRYQQTGVRDILAKQVVQNFYEKIVIKHESTFQIHLSALMLDEKVLATHWGGVHNGRFYYLMPTYAKQWGKYSPGRLLLEKLMEWSIDNQVGTFDFTIGSEDYKKLYCDQEVGICDYVKLVSHIGMSYFLIHYIVVFLKTNPRIRHALTSAITKLRKIRDILF
jgi:CelD/BcsL family acetyltransferase involved in cellulose biosynthesis